MIVVFNTFTKKFMAKILNSQEYYWGSIFEACCFRDEIAAMQTFMAKFPGHLPNEIISGNAELFSHWLTTTQSFPTFNNVNNFFDYHTKYLGANNFEEIKDGIFKRGLIFIGVKIDTDVPYRSMIVIIKRKFHNRNNNDNTFAVIYRGGYFLADSYLTKGIVNLLRLDYKPNESEKNLYYEICNEPTEPEIGFLTNMINGNNNGERNL